MRTKILITAHAEKRAKSRANLKGKMLLHLAIKAWCNGLDYKTAQANLQEYIKRKYQSSYRAENIRVYGHYVYIFAGNTLVSFLELPEYLWYFWYNKKSC